jgi:hypothetical protein
VIPSLSTIGATAPRSPSIEQQERLVGQDKGGEGGGFEGKKVQAEKVGSKEIKGKRE